MALNWKCRGFSFLTSWTDTFLSSFNQVGNPLLSTHNVAKVPHFPKADSFNHLVKKLLASMMVTQTFIGFSIFGSWWVLLNPQELDAVAAAVAEMAVGTGGQQ